MRAGGGERGTAVAVARGDRAWGGAQAVGTPGLCLRRGSLTSGAPTVTSRGGGDVRPRGRTPRTNVKVPGALRKNSVPAGGVEVGENALPDPWQALPLT